MGIPNFTGQTFGQYELREIIGTGGMGTVYRAYQKILRRIVAVKVLPSTLMSDPDFVERFHREAETAAALEHPHIIPVYDYGVQADTSYIVMRLLTGGTLSERLLQREQAHDPLPSLGEIADLLDQLARAFDYAHAKGVIHRDIKPSNIMFDNQGNAFVVDFGIARLIAHTHSLTGAGLALGTPSYMAPEQWRTEPLTPATDQYALGVTVYLLITGQVPFSSPTPHGLMHKHLNEMPTAPHAVRSEVPEEVSIVLDRAMAKDPADRFPTLTAFTQAFESAVAGARGESTGFFLPLAPPTPLTSPGMVMPDLDEGEAAPPVSDEIALPGRAVPFYRNRLIWAGGLVALVVLVVMLALIVSGGGSDEAGEETATTPTSGGEGPATQSAIIILPSHTPTPTAVASDTPVPTETPSPTDTVIPSATPDMTLTALALVAEHLTQMAEQFTDTPTPNLDATVQAMAVEALTSTAQSWTDTPTPTVTDTPTPIPTDTATSIPSDTPSPPPTDTSTPTATPTEAATATPTASPTPTSPPTSAPIIVPTATLVGGGLGQIAFVSDRETGLPEIYIMDIEGDNVQRLTADMARVDSPAWSPDGNRIAFVSNREGTDAIYVMDADGSNRARLTQDSASNRWPAWSPDGSQLAFMSDRDGNSEIYVMNADGSDVRRVTNHLSADRFPAWSPDGGQIVFQSERDGNRELYVITLADDEPTIMRLTTSSGDDRFAMWSPDGTTIAFQSDRDGNNEIYLMNPDGSNLRNLTNHFAEDRYPAWSPDGSRIVFQSERDGNRELYVMNADGSGVRRLTDHAANDWSPVWRPAPLPCQMQFTSIINVRIGPGTEYDVLGVTTTDTPLYVNGRNADSSWWRVYFGDEAGWISGVLDSVQLLGDCGAIPVADG